MMMTRRSKTSLEGLEVPIWDMIELLLSVAYLFYLSTWWDVSDMMQSDAKSLSLYSYACKGV